MWQSFLINLGVSLVKSYIESTSSKDDDKVLDVAKIGVNYLAKKETNSVTEEISKALNDTDMRQIQKAK